MFSLLKYAIYFEYFLSNSYPSSISCQESKQYSLGRGLSPQCIYNLLIICRIVSLYLDAIVKANMTIVSKTGSVQTVALTKKNYRQRGQST